MDAVLSPIATSTPNVYSATESKDSSVNVTKVISVTGKTVTNLQSQVCFNVVFLMIF